MAEYIDRQAAIAKKREYNLGGSYDNTEFAVPVDVINSIPAADVRPVVLGKWEHFGSDVFRCSECGYGILPWNVGVNFCPNCGAEMRTTK